MLATPPEAYRTGRTRALSMVGMVGAVMLGQAVLCAHGLIVVRVQCADRLGRDRQQHLRECSGSADVIVFASPQVRAPRPSKAIID